MNEWWMVALSTGTAAYPRKGRGGQSSLTDVGLSDSWRPQFWWLHVGLFPVLRLVAVAGQKSSIYMHSGTFTNALSIFFH